MAEKTTKNSEGTGVSVPYVGACGNITKVLNKIQTAATPDRFTHDFLGTKLGLTGGSATPLVPFLKRTGFLKSDGAPTDLYKAFRNDALRGAAAAQAVRTGYAPLYEVNEYLHELSDKDLKGVVVQATGFDANSSTVKSIVGSFKALKTFADFDAKPHAQDDVEEEDDAPDPKPLSGSGRGARTEIKLGYTINLNLPATSDVAVFNAIFKSLKEHLID